MLLTELMAARDEQWAEAVAEGPRAMAVLRAEYVAAGWTICEHPACPPFNCQAS